MALSAAERQQRHHEQAREVVEIVKAKAAFADLVRDGYRQGALAALAGWATDRPGDAAKAIAAGIEAHLEDPADLLNAAIATGEAWARAQWLSRHAEIHDPSKRH